MAFLSFDADDALALLMQDVSSSPACGADVTGSGNAQLLAWADQALASAQGLASQPASDGASMLLAEAEAAEVAAALRDGDCKRDFKDDKPAPKRSQFVDANYSALVSGESDISAERCGRCCYLSQFSRS